jgi:hypothetical protein
MRYTLKQIAEMKVGTCVATEGVIVKASTPDYKNMTQAISLVDDKASFYAGVHLKSKSPLVNNTKIIVEEAYIRQDPENGDKYLEVMLFTIPSASEPPEGSPYEYVPKKPDKDTIIVRQNTLNRAVDIYRCCNMFRWPPPDKDMEEIKELARQFQNYIFKGK